MSDDDQLVIIQNSENGITDQPRYSQHVRDLCFKAWIEADMNTSRAHRALVRLCSEADADDELPLPSELPTVQTMNRWARLHAWEAKATQATFEHFPAISAKQAARLVRQTDIAQEEWSAIMAGERDHLSGPALNARVALISLNKTLRGLGTAAAKGSEPALPAPAFQVDTEEDATEANSGWRSGKRSDVGS